MEISHGIRAVFFDLDGVLVDAANWHRDAFVLACERFNIEPPSQEEHEKTFNGLSTRRKLSILDEMGRIPESTCFDAFYDVKQEYTEQFIHSRCKPIQRVLDTVMRAKEIGPTAVVTNCSRNTCYLMLELSGLTELFDVIITNQDVDGKIKPHPWPYLMARFHFCLNSKEALVIDDTYKGITSAIEAQCETWRLTNFEDLTVDNFNRKLESLKIRL